MTTRGTTVAAVTIALAAWAVVPAFAAPLAVVVRDGGDAALAVTRLRGQVADLDIVLRIAPGPIEPALDAQLAAASRLAAAHGARAVVWFVPRAGGLAVAIATPGDHRLFVREIPAAAASTVAEAAAVAARGALRAIADGGAIGIEVPAPRPVAEPPPAAELDRRLGVAVAVGWQVALDGGADAGAHAVAERTTAGVGPWAAVLALSWGPALRRGATEAAPGLVVDLSRSSAALGVERRLGEFSLGASAGVVLYHRATVATPAGLSATPATTTAALVAGPELAWRWRPGDGAIGAEVSAALDVVVGAPDPAVARGMDVASLGSVRALQPRFMASIFAELR